MNSREPLRARLLGDLESYEQQHGALPGIRTNACREAFVEQLVDGIRRIQFINATAARKISPIRQSVSDPAFDPVRAAMRFKAAGNIDEACWLVFLSIHCGKHGSQGWKLVRDLYGGEDSGSEWTWKAVAAGIGSFRAWLSTKNRSWTAAGTRAKFGNHRKYETLRDTANGTGAVVESYVNWVGRAGGHQALFDEALALVEGDEHEAFDRLYRSMRSVRRFGRLAKFDYLCMLGKLELAPISPGHPYIDSATGPLAGAKLLMGANLRTYDAPAARLSLALNIPMQVMEDALCNWEKSPRLYRPFRG